MATLSLWLGLVLLFDIMSPIWSDGYIQLRLIKYWNDDGKLVDKENCDFLTACDFYLVLTLDTLVSGGGQKWPEMKSKVFDDNKVAKFGVKFNKNTTNPFRKTFGKWTGRLNIKVLVHDADVVNPDHADTFITKVERKPDGKEKQFAPSSMYHGKKSGLTFTVKVSCSPNYYTDSCTKYCKATDDARGHYSCDGNGKKICIAGWQNPENDCRDISFDCRKFGSRCKNGGTCRYSPDGFSCSCPRAYAGRRCEITQLRQQNSVWSGNSNEECPIASNLCKNGGTCVMSQGKALCQCSSAYGGKHCELVHHCSIKRSCLNGGVCSNGTGVFRCQCYSPFTGNLCESKISSPKPQFQRQGQKTGVYMLAIFLPVTLILFAIIGLAVITSRCRIRCIGNAVPLSKQSSENPLSRYHSSVHNGNVRVDYSTSDTCKTPGVDYRGFNLYDDVDFRGFSAAPVSTHATGAATHESSVYSDPDHSEGRSD